MVPKFLSALLAVLVLAQPSRSAPVVQQQPLKPAEVLSNFTFNFDDLPTSAKGLGKISSNSTYQHLEFTNLTVVHTPKAWEHKILTNPHELLCATSAPNALFTANFASYNSTPSNHSIPRSRMYLNTTSSASHGGPVAFNLVALSLGPLGIIPPFPANVLIRFGLYFIDSPFRTEPDDAELRWSLSAAYGAGAYPSRRIPLRQYFGDSWGRGVNMIETWAERGEFRAPGEEPAEPVEWGFCVDDIEVEWVSADEAEA